MKREMIKTIEITIDDRICRLHPKMKKFIRRFIYAFIRLNINRYIDVINEAVNDFLIRTGFDKITDLYYKLKIYVRCSDEHTYERAMKIYVDSDAVIKCIDGDKIHYSLFIERTEKMTIVNARTLEKLDLKDYPEDVRRLYDEITDDIYLRVIANL